MVDIPRFSGGGYAATLNFTIVLGRSWDVRAYGGSQRWVFRRSIFSSRIEGLLG
jgi:hypothetical protein